MKVIVLLVALLLPSAALAVETVFAEIDVNGIVLRVIVADQKFIDTGAVGDPKKWIMSKTDGSVRKNPPSKGYTYDKAKDHFVPPQPYPSWTLDANAKWQPPITMPIFKSGEKPFRWDELSRAWKAGN